VVIEDRHVSGMLHATTNREQLAESSPDSLNACGEGSAGAGLRVDVQLPSVKQEPDTLDASAENGKFWRTGMMRDGSDEQQEAPPNGTRSSGALAPGDRVGEYEVVRLVTSSGTGHTYLARIAPGEHETQEERQPGPLEPVFHLVERPVGGHEGLRRLVGLRLHHPRLLAPRSIISEGDRDYLVVDAVADSNGAGAEASSATQPLLSPTEALAAGVGLADALTYLHSSGVAHLRVSPASVAIGGGRIQLGGVEQAQLVHPLDLQSSPLFARDANFLARTLGVLAGVSEEAPRGADPTTAALAEIVARGAAGGFNRPEEVGAACSAALPQTELALPEAQPLPDSGRLGFTVGCATSVGQVRSENQDAAALAIFDVLDEAQPGSGSGATPAGVFLVADGMGGEARGELASRIAARMVMTEVTQELMLPVLRAPVEAAQAGMEQGQVALPSVADALERAANSANERIRKLASLLGQTTGTTLTAVAVLGVRAALVHVGDSRGYLLRAGQLTQMTEDHTLLARLQALDHPLLHDPAFVVPRNYLYRSLGQDDEAELQVAEFTVAPGDRLLLCSDGLWDEVSPDQLLSVLAEATNPEECARALVAAADAGGGHDNSTAVVVFVDGPTEPQAAEG
jgi:serine/threonine protein phosphatase PrpC